MDKLYTAIDEHLLKDTKPSRFLNEIYDNDKFSQKPFDMLWRLRQVEQSPKYHREGHVWNHTMLVLDEAAKVREKSRDKKVFMWASLLHDIGKATTTKIRKGRITAYGHDLEGARLTKEFLSHFTEDTLFINKVANLVRYHMHILYVLKDLPFADMEGLKRDTDVYEVALLGFCDRLGRLDTDPKKERANIESFLEKVQGKGV